LRSRENSFVVVFVELTSKQSVLADKKSVCVVWFVVFTSLLVVST